MTICIFGDSIAWGADDTEKGGWADRLKTHCFREGKDVEIYNLGILGDVTEGVLSRFDAECDVRNPQIIIFAVGINDTQFLRSANAIRISLEDFSKNIYSLIEKAKKYTNQIIFIGLTRVDESKVQPLPWNKDKEYRNENIEQYDGVLRKITEENGCFYIEMKNAVSIDTMEDGLHPNSQGHEKMARVILENGHLGI